MVYGIDVKDENDIYVQMSEEALVGSTQGLVPGKFLVEFLPFLRHIPPWFPGAASQRLWAKWMAAGDRLLNAPFEHTRAKLVRSPSIYPLAASCRRFAPYDSAGERRSHSVRH